MLNFIHYFAVFSIVLSIFTQARKMNHQTPVVSKVKNGIFLILSLLSLSVFGLREYACVILALAIGVYLWIDSIALMIGLDPHAHQ